MSAYLCCVLCKDVEQCFFVYNVGVTQSFFMYNFGTWSNLFLSAQCVMEVNSKEHFPGGKRFSKPSSPTYDRHGLTRPTRDRCGYPGDRAARLLSGMVVKELMRQAPEQFQGHAAAVLPLAFVARSDEEADVATVWSEVWEEGGTSLRLYVPDIVPLVLRGTCCSLPSLACPP